MNARPSRVARPLPFTTTMSLALAFSILGNGCRQPPTDSLTILHTNDTHARFEQIEARGSHCSDASRGCFGGVARRATKIDEVRAAVPNVLLLDAGDQFQGTLLYTRFKGRVAAAMMNLLGYDAMVVGNHEFDDGPDNLARFAAELDFPLLATNIDASGEAALNGQLRTAVTVDVDGNDVGIVGVITEVTAALSSPGEAIRFLNIEEALEPVIEALEANRTQRIIVLSHAGFERDQQLASTVRGIDVIVGGHTNTLLSNSDPGAAGPYPVVIEGAGGDPVLVVTAFAWGKYLGRLNVVFDAEGRIIDWDGEPILLDSSIPESETVKSALRPFQAALDTFGSRVIGRAVEDLVGDEAVCRFNECTMGDLIADALRVESSADVALMNSGGIRSGIPAGEITIGHILEVLPFGNSMSTFGLRGEDLWQALEHGLSQADKPGSDTTGRYLQVSGLRLSWSAAAAPGERLVEVEVAAGDGSWEALDRERIYSVVANSFTRTGGDDFAVLLHEAIEPYDEGRFVSDVLIDYVEKHPVVDRQLDGRIRRLEQ